MKAEDERLAYSVQDAAKKTGFSSSTLYKYAADGELVMQKRGNRTFVMHDELMRFLRASPKATPTYTGR